jgi:hypothetical protein
MSGFWSITAAGLITGASSSYVFGLASGGGAAGAAAALAARRNTRNALMMVLQLPKIDRYSGNDLAKLVLKNTLQSSPYGHLCAWQVHIGPIDLSSRT